MQRTTLAAVAGLLTSLLVSLAAKYGFDLTPEQRADLSEILVQLLVLGGLAIPAAIGYLRNRRGVAPIVLPKEEVKQLQAGTAEVTQIPPNQRGFTHVGAAITLAGVALLVCAVVLSTGCTAVSIPKQIAITSESLVAVANEVGAAKRAGAISAETRTSILDQLDKIQLALESATSLYYLKDELGTARQMQVVNDLLAQLQTRLAAEGVPNAIK